MENTIGTFSNTQRKTGTAEKVALSNRQIYRIENHNTAMQIQGVKGTVYVTAPEDPEDHILRPGEQIIVRNRGLVLVQGLPEGAFQYSPR